MMAHVSWEESKLNRSPLDDKVNLAKRCCDSSFGHEQLPMQRYYGGKWYDYDYEGGYNQISDEEAGQLVTESLIHCYDLKGAVSTELHRDVMTILQTDECCGLSARKYQMPCLLSSGKDASRILLMKNGSVSIDKILETMKAGRPRPKTQQTTPDLFSTWKKDYDYIPTAKCPNFLKFLKEIQPNKANREALQKMAGLCLIPDCSYEKAFVLYGPAGTGKTTFLKVLKVMQGKECWCSVPLAKLADVSNGALLAGKLVNFSSDMSLGAEPERAEAALKAVASGEEIPIEQPDGSGIRMANARARCIFETNTLPHFLDKSNAVWDRLCLIPFNRVSRGTAKQNPHLADDLNMELSGILTWALEGLFKLHAQKTFQQGRESEAALIDWRKECDPAGAYLMEMTEVNPKGRIDPSDLHFSYSRWAEAHGVPTVAGTEFVKTILRTYPNASVYKSSGSFWLKGIGYRKSC